MSVYIVLHSYIFSANTKFASLYCGLSTDSAGSFTDGGVMDNCGTGTFAHAPGTYSRSKLINCNLSATAGLFTPPF